MFDAACWYAFGGLVILTLCWAGAEGYLIYVEEKTRTEPADERS